tara:strand:- start:39 stop:1301 length:1263 start_codon:yes stop_codon:yes gene_type:complete
MALISCYECSREISDKAPACPHCGAPAGIRSDHVEEPQVTQHQDIETEQQEELAPEPVSETPKKDEPFNQFVAFAVGALVFQIVRALGISLGALSVVFMIAPIVLLVRYVKKQTTQVYAGIILGLVVVMGIAVAAGPGYVFVPQAVETTSDRTAPQPSIRENTSTPRVESRSGSTAISFSCDDFNDLRRRESDRGGSVSLEIVRHCAEQWHPDAMTILGIRHAAGTGLPVDNVRAFMWLSLGHLSGDSSAQMFRDLTGAKMSADQLSDAVELFGEYLEANPPPISEGSPAPQRSRATLSPFQQNRLSADQGDARAQYNLGLMYANGQGVPQDYVEAGRWYRLAADQGHADAQHNLGVMHANGQGVQFDYVQAYKWWDLAQTQGHAESRKEKAIIQINMTPDQIAEGQRMSREWMARHPPE